MNLELEQYDKSKIGKLISWGGDHTVYNYGTDKVIKFSLIGLMMGQGGLAKIIRDYEISKKFFGDFVLTTCFLKPQGKKLSVAIQTKIAGHYLHKKDLTDPVVNNQFRKIMEDNRQLLLAGYDQIDFVGRGGVFTNSFSNIFVTPTKQLVIIDTTLIEFKGSRLFYPLFWFIELGAKWRNNVLIRKYIEFSNVCHSR